MTTVFRIHLAGLLLLSYAALFNSMSVQKLTVNSSKPTQEPRSSTVPELSMNGAGIIYSRGAGDSMKDKDTLRLHNVLRRDVDPPASNMPKLGWSSNLARLAELWSRHCIMGYGLPLTLDPLTYSGQILQNIWLGGRDGTIEDALSSWLKEGNGYNFKTRACYRANGCKNYLTIVSASAHEVGCGLSHCNDGVIVVCYYGARNYKSHQSPYAAGKPCSQCGALEWCDSGLCRPSGNKRKYDSVGTNCVSKNIDRESTDENSAAVPLADGSQLERQRRDTTDGTTSALNTCSILDVTMWIAVGVLIGVVFIGFLIVIICLLAPICQNRCTCCRDRDSACGGRRLGCLTTGEDSSSFTGSGSSGTSETRGRLFCCVACRFKCCRNTSIIPEEGTWTSDRGDASGSSDLEEEENPLVLDSPDANISSLVHAATPVTCDVEYREMCTNTDPEPTTAGTSVDLDCIDAETQVDAEYREMCTNTDLEPTTAGTSVDLYCIDAETQVDAEYREMCPNTDPEPTTVDRSTSIEHDLLETNDVAVQVKIKAIREDSSHGVCLVHNCQGCDLHKRDQREVDELRTNSTRKLIKASKTKNLAPGTYII